MPLLKILTQKKNYVDQWWPTWTKIFRNERFST